MHRISNKNQYILSTEKNTMTESRESSVAPGDLLDKSEKCFQLFGASQS